LWLLIYLAAERVENVVVVVVGMMFSVVSRDQDMFFRLQNRYSLILLTYTLVFDSPTELRTTKPQTT
jgi:hypothetical protein